MTEKVDFDFSDEVKRRLGNWDSIVVPNGITEASDPFRPFGDTNAFDFESPQAVVVPNSKQPGYSQVYRNASTGGKVLSTWHPSIHTVHDALNASFKAYASRKFLGTRERNPITKEWGNYKFETYRQIEQRRDNFGSGLVHVVEQQARMTPTMSRYIVAFYGPNSANWCVGDFACVSQSLPTVCLYDTLGAGTTEFILQFTSSPVVLASVANIPKLLQLKSKLPHVKVIIALGSLESEYDVEAAGESKKALLSAWATKEGVALYGFDEVEKIGFDNPRPHIPPRRDDIYTINFTSGTTGNPKGVILTHTNIVAGILFVKFKSRLPNTTSPQDSSYSFLPLAHVSERMTILTDASSGASVGFAHGVPAKALYEDLLEFQPTTQTLVPRVFNRIVSKIKLATVEAPGEQGKLARHAFDKKMALLKKTGVVNHQTYDRILCEPSRRVIGFENIKVLNTGSAPLAPEIQDFLKVMIGVEVIQAYGLTEAAAGMCCSMYGDPVAGSCGPCGPCVELRLRDLPELGYSSDDKPYPRGEVMLRGPQVFRGYYREEAKTLEALDEDGWFHTGDVGKVDAMGRLFIIDRVKHFFKLSQGEYISPEKIENVYQSRNTLIDQIFVHGLSSQSFLVAIVGVNLQKFGELLSVVFGKSINLADEEALSRCLADREVRTAFLKAINENIEDGALLGFEKISNVRLFVEPFKLSEGTITDTLKIKRHAAARAYEHYVNQMYSEGKLGNNTKHKL